MFLAAARFDPQAAERERAVKRAKHEEPDVDMADSVEQQEGGRSRDATSASEVDSDSEADSSSDSDSDNDIDNDSDSDIDNDSDNDIDIDNHIDSHNDNDNDIDSHSDNNKNNNNKNNSDADGNGPEGDGLETRRNGGQKKEKRMATFFDDATADDAELVVEDEHYHLLKKFRERMSSLASKHKFGREIQLEESENLLADEDMEEPIRPVKPAEQQAVQLHGLEPIPQLEQVEGPTIGELGWIAPPTYIDEDKFEDWNRLGLSAAVQNGVAQLGYKQAFAVQTGVIPFIIDQNKSCAPDNTRDVLVNAFTGSGKTLAYAAPIVDTLRTRVSPRIRALVVVPTRPLCVQVYQVIESLAQAAGSDLRVIALGQDASVPIREEQELLRHVTPDILVSTPGRLVDQLRQMPDELNLGHVRFLVVDEADRLLNQSFDMWTEVLRDRIATDAERVRPRRVAQTGVLSYVAPYNRPPQKLVFSATLTRDPGKLLQLGICANPQIFLLSQQGVQAQFSVPQGLTEHMIRMDSLPEKPLVLMQQLLVQNITKHAIVFVRSSQSAARLAQLIKILDESTFHLNLVIDVCSGDVAMNERNAAIKRLDTGQTDILVATDLVARGLDISSIEHVLNYDLPGGTHEYVHRVGRTARAKKEGHAWNIVCGDKEEAQFWELTNRVARKTPIDRQEHGEFADELLSKYDEALKELSQRVYRR